MHTTSGSIRCVKKASRRSGVEWYCMSLALVMVLLHWDGLRYKMEKMQAMKLITWFSSFILQLSMKAGAESHLAQPNSTGQILCEDRKEVFSLTMKQSNE
mmetsp:Transcript_32087/g.54763  ORF Transcript_32087/g.54763 Transcript_32087/m.54763 type:complete len:100 (+) Transcript_32087:772-1071(+)